MKRKSYTKLKILKTVSPALFALILGGCVHGRINSLPVKVDGVVGDVYMYQGRDNFAHQQTAAETMMRNFCSKNHPGSSVSLLKKEIVDLGTVSFGNSSTNVYGSATGTTVGSTTSIVGSGTAYTSGSATRLRNFDQRLFFQCLGSTSVQSISTSTAAPAKTPSVSSDDSSSISALKTRLEELNELVEEGLITEEDYERKKAELLEDID